MRAKSIEPTGASMPGFSFKLLIVSIGPAAPLALMVGFVVGRKTAPTESLLALELPKARGPDEAYEMPVVKIGSDDKMTVDGYPMGESELFSVLRNASQRNSNAHDELRARVLVDRKASAGALLQVMGALTLNGFNKVALGPAEPSRRRPGPPAFMTIRKMPSP